MAVVHPWSIILANQTGCLVFDTRREEKLTSVVSKKLLCCAGSVSKKETGFSVMVAGGALINN